MDKLDQPAHVGETISPTTLCDLVEDAVAGEPAEDATQHASLGQLDVASLPRLMSAAAAAAGGAAVGEAGVLEVRGVLGEGGMGRVQLALQRSLQREVAVKRLRDAESPHRRRLSNALLWEARVMGALEHPNITPIHELGCADDGSPLLVMKRISGESWRQLIAHPSHPMWASLEASGRARLDVHLDVLVQLCNALHYAHSFGIIHRDLKPDNVMLGAFGEVYLVDWGTAVRLPHAAGGGVVGTPAYMAPEMARDEAVSARTDVFLLGATLYELLSGHPPYQAPSVMACLWKAAHGDAPPLPASLPAELVAICARAMSADPAARFESPAALRLALEAFRQHQGSHEVARAALERTQALLVMLRPDASPPPDRQALYELAAECRFGLRLALRQWPDNAQAAAALRACVHGLLQFELRAQNIDAATALLAELPPADPARADTLAALADMRRALADERAQILRLRRLTDYTTGGRARVLTFGAVAVASAVIAARAIWTRFSDSAPISPTRAMLDMSVLLAVASISIVTLRRRFGGTPFNRRFLSLLVLAFLSMTVNRALGIHFDRPLSQTFSGDLWLSSVICATVGIALHPWGWGLAAISVAGGLVATFSPINAQLALNICGTLILCIAAVVAVRAPPARASLSASGGSPVESAPP
jgi:eukaryotic-like serine/threonine-protein kinase